MARGKGGIKEEVERLIENMDVKVDKSEVRKVGGGRGMVMVKLGSIEQKKMVMEKKKRLKERKEKIEDDLTWKERRRWMINARMVARKEEGKGRIVWKGYRGVKIDGK